MDDAGRLFLGYVLVWFLIDLSQGERRLLTSVTALWLFALPLIDTVLIMVRRMLYGRSPFLANQRYLHHLLLTVGFSPKRTLVLMLIVALAAVCVGLAGYFLGVLEHWMFLGFACLFVLYFRATMRACKTLNL